MSTSRLHVLPLAALLSVGAVACSTVKSTERANLIPFAEQTVSSLGVKPVYFRDNVHLQAHFEPSAPEVVALRAALAEADRFQAEVVDYSVELVRISTALNSEQDKVDQLADLIEREASNGFINTIGADSDQVEASLAEIRVQEKLLPALRGTQALVDQSEDYFSALIPAIRSGRLTAVRDMLREQIDTHYAMLLEYEGAAAIRRDELLQGLLLTRSYRRGDKTALTKLRQNEIVLQRGLKVPSSASEAQLARIESYLMAELQKAHQSSQYLANDYDAYVQAHVELDRAYTEMRAELDFTRLQFLAWTRAYQAMANGITDPAKIMKLARFAPWPTH